MPGLELTASGAQRKLANELSSFGDTVGSLLSEQGLERTLRGMEGVIGKEQLARQLEEARYWHPRTHTPVHQHAMTRPDRRARPLQRDAAFVGACLHGEGAREPVLRECGEPRPLAQGRGAAEHWHFRRRRPTCHWAPLSALRRHLPCRSLPFASPAPPPLSTAALPPFLPLALSHASALALLTLPRVTVEACTLGSAAADAAMSHVHRM